MAGRYPLRSLTQRGLSGRHATAGRRRSHRIDSTCLSLGFSRGALFRNRLLDLLLADALQLLVLLRAKNFLHPRRGFAVDGPKLLHFCIGGSEVSFLIASIFGPSSLRIGSIWTFCSGVSLSCCDNACNFAAGSAAGGREIIRKKACGRCQKRKLFLVALLLHKASSIPSCGLR